MAYTAVVTKESVSRVSSVVYQVTIKLTVNDGILDVFESSVSEQYNSNSADLEGIKDRLIAQLQERWDKYAAEQGVYVAAAFDTMVGEIQTAANTYVNT